MKRQGPAGAQGAGDQPVQKPGGDGVGKRPLVTSVRGNDRHCLCGPAYHQPSPKEKVDFPTPHHNAGQSIQSQELK